MAIESDVLVIGGGLAGMTAALAASRANVSVRLVSYKQSTLRNASGLIDILGYTPDGDGPVVNPYERIPELPDEHPYQIVGLDVVRNALALFDEVVPTYRGSHTERNALLPTHGGTFKPTARYPAGTNAGLVSQDGDVLFVGLASMTDFDAAHTAAHLAAAGVPFETRGVTVTFPGDLRPDAKVTRYAKLLDANSEVSVRGRSRPAREALAARVNPKLKGEDRVGFPAILGDDNAAAVRNELAEKLGAEVFEVPMGPPSLPGLRLEERLFAAMDEAGVRIETGNPVTGYEGSDSIERVFVEKNGAKIPNRASQYVLATGGLVGKGINSDRDGVYEPLFDCYISQIADRYEWFDGDVFGTHEFPRFGVPVDNSLRPTAEDGSVEFDNLRAAGSVLGGYDFAAEKSGSGVSLATGYAAGTESAQEAQ